MRNVQIHLSTPPDQETLQKKLQSEFFLLKTSVIKKSLLK